MKMTQRIASERRNSSADLLFDEEAQKASTVETSERRSEGDEYFDLEQFAQGVPRYYES